MTYLFKTDHGSVDDVRPIPPEVSVRLVLQDENYVSRDVVWSSVAFLGEGDLGALFPPTLDDKVQDLILSPHGSAIRVQPPPGDLHSLGRPMIDLLQRDLQLMDYRWILHLSAHVDGFRVPPVHPIDPTETKPAKGTERIVAVLIDIHVLMVEAVEDTGTAAGEEDVKGVGAPKEGSKGGMGVSMEGVVESVP